ncbi:MAG: TRAP transporter large permease [Planctomycetota bacterium]|jgi:tripartite ATP-independent transporter DctM subunit|nr:TRAP transporter large permease [Planctomycetota bacterium]
MSFALTILVAVFLFLMVCGLPIAFNLLLSSMIYMLARGFDLMLIGQKMYEGMSSFSFLAVPFFVITGQLMLKGKLLETLIDFVNVFFGRYKGAVAIVTIGAALLMGAIVGLAVASAAALGVFLIPMMKREGYSSAFAAAVMSSASLLGPIMPPSVLMIMYCIAVGRTSIAGLFLAAVVPAVLITTAQMLVANHIARKRNYSSYPPATGAEMRRAIRKAIPALFLPAIILGGIFGGVFTITEASAIAVLYSAFLAVYVNRAIGLRDVPSIFMESALTSGLVLLLAGAGSDMAWAIATERVLASLIGPLSAIPPWLFLLIVNILLLINGCFMDDYASVVILAPIIAPVAWALGIEPLHIAAVICINLVIGLATPPFGITLFVTSPIAKVKIEDTVREAIPFLVVTTMILFLVTFVPEVCLFLPKTFGYI